jgi:hypothetical protein
MSANPNLHNTHHETSGESVFFAMALAFGAVMIAIIAGAFMPLVAGIGMIFGVLAVVLVLVGIFLARVLGEG